MWYRPLASMTFAGLAGLYLYGIMVGALPISCTIQPIIIA